MKYRIYCERSNVYYQVDGDYPNDVIGAVYSKAQADRIIKRDGCGRERLEKIIEETDSFMHTPSKRKIYEIPSS